MSCNINASRIDKIEIEIPNGILHNRSPMEIPMKLDTWRTSLYELYLVRANMRCITLMSNESHKK